MYPPRLPSPHVQEFLQRSNIYVRFRILQNTINFIITVMLVLSDFIL